MNTPVFPADSGANATAADLEHAMLAQANPADAKILMSFFKTGPGQYGEGDKFLGCKNPVTRRTAKAFRDLPVREAVRAAHSEWHEIRLCAMLILLGYYESKKTSDRDRADIFEQYAELARGGFVNNWDLVDLTAPDIAGAYAFAHGVKTLERFALHADARGRLLPENGSHHLDGRLFSAGDMRNGQSLVVRALADGRAAAREADEWMR